MSAATNALVAAGKKYGLPAAFSTAVALGALAVMNHTGVHADNTASPLDDHSVAALTSLDQAMEAVAARVTPEVVNIAVTSTPSADEMSQQQQGGDDGGQMQGLPPGFGQFFGPGGPFGGMQQQRPQQPELEHGIGSGVIISPDGYIVTNNHVVDGAKDIKVTLNDRRVLNGKVVGTDKLTDIAVVKVNAHDLPAMPWGDSGRLEPGQTVLAFGSPFGYLRFSVTRGIVSAINRDNPYRTDARQPGGFIQTDASINPGNSGGPLVNAHGQLVGINEFIISNNGAFSGAGFAIPSDRVHAVATQIIAHGKAEHGYLGISLNDVTPDNASFFGLKDAAGAIVAQVTPDSPASRGGLKQGDVITGLNGQAILSSSTLQAAVSEVAPGTRIALGVMRDGHTQTVNVTVGEYGNKGEQVAENDASGTPNSGKLGLAVADLTQDVRQQLRIPGDVHGAVVENVRPASPADDAGLERGDVILEVNRKPLTSADQFVSAVHGAANGHDLLLLVWSKGNASYRTVHEDAQNG